MTRRYISPITRRYLVDGEPYEIQLHGVAVRAVFARDSLAFRLGHVEFPLDEVVGVRVVAPPRFTWQRRKYYPLSEWFLAPKGATGHPKARRRPLPNTRLRHAQEKE